MSKLTFKEFLIEAPLGDYKTVGDWSKGSSFRDKRDRIMVQHPKSIENVRKKLGKSPYVWNLIFVNSAKARKHMEVGEVSLDWVRKELGDDVAKEVSDKLEDDAINVIYTNNFGDEKRVMTPWIMMHRFAHAVAKRNGSTLQHSQYKEAANHLISNLADIMELYNVGNFPRNNDNMTGYRDSHYRSADPRKNQLIMMYFFYEVATFRSAREKNIRDWFEVLNELIAQYITTGAIKFKDAPQTFGNKAWGNSAIRYHTNEQEAASEMLQTLARDMEYMIDGILGAALNSIYVM